MKIKKGSANVYSDLGMQDAEEMLVKARLATRIGELIHARKFVQQQAAKPLNISQPMPFQHASWPIQGISEVKMLECLTLLGNDVSIVVKSRRTTRSAGNISVVFA